MQIKTETKVGAFVIIALIILAYTANYLSAFRWHLRSYDAYMVVFQNVSGLIKKADIKIAGVKVGWVDKIKLAGNGMQAEAVLMVSDQYKLYLDATAEIKQEGLLGSKFVDLRPGAEGSGLIAPGTCLVLEGCPSASIEDLVHKFDDIARNIDEVSAALKAALGPSQQLENLQGIVTNVADFTNVLARNRDNVDSIVKNLNLFAERIAPVGSDIQRVARRLDQVLEAQDLDTVCHDVRSVTNNFRQVVDTYDQMRLVVDTHTEAMTKTTSDYAYKDAKSYFGLRFHTGTDWFHLFQLARSEEGGVVDRNEVYHTYFDQNNDQLTDAALASLGSAFAVVPVLTKETKVRRNVIRYSYQIGHIFSNLALRFGAFEGFFGLAADYDIPFNTDKFRWVTSLELFDFKGQNRLADRRPHLKWLNKLFFLKNLYMTFGVDDFVSKNHISPFFGVGIRFGDDDFKALIDKFGSPPLD